MTRFAVLGRGLALGIALGSGPAWGQGSSDKATADALFDAARQEMEADNYAAACPKLAESQRLDPGVGTLLNLGKCYERVDKIASAWSSYREATSLAKREAQSERESFARAESERLEHLLTKVVVTVGPELAGLSGLEVVGGGKILPKTLWEVPLPVDAGEYVLHVSAPGYRAAEVRVQARGPGKTFSVAAPSLEREPGLATPAVVLATETAATSQTKGEAPERSGGAGAGPWIVGGAGLAFLGAGVVTALLGQAENQKALALCPDYESNGCSSSDVSDWRGHTSAAQLDYTLSYVAFGAGGALVVGSLTWLLVSGKPSRESAFHVEPRLAPGSYGVSVRGAF